MSAQHQWTRACALAWFALSACTDEEMPTPAPAPDAPDARVQRDYDASDVDGAWEEHVMGMLDPLDPVDAVETPVLDLPLVVMRPRGPRVNATIAVRVLYTA
jgi:hypothetical protein